MNTERIEKLLEDIRHQSEARYVLVQQLRELIRWAGDEVTEEVKYGGFLFSGRSRDFAGVFSYSRHVSVELSEGASLDDPHQVLEGGGKYRRHIKLHSLDDIEQKHVGEYVRAAYQQQIA